MNFGIDRLLAEPTLRAPLAGRRVALLAHPASVTAGLGHSLDALADLPGVRLAAVHDRVPKTTRRVGQFLADAMRFVEEVEVQPHTGQAAKRCFALLGVVLGMQVARL